MDTERGNPIITVDAPDDFLLNKNCKLIKEKVIPTVIRKFNKEFEIIKIADRFIVDGFYIKIDGDNLISAVYLKNCWHPNSVYFPFEYHEQFLLQDEKFFNRPPNLLKFCIPSLLENMYHNDENIQKLIRGIQIWNLNSSYWSNSGIGLLEAKRKVYPVEDENCRIENIKSYFQQICEANKKSDIDIYFNCDENNKFIFDGFLMEKLPIDTIKDYQCAVDWFNKLVPYFNIYKIHKIGEDNGKGRIEIIHTITGITSLMLQGKKDGEK